MDPILTAMLGGLLLMWIYFKLSEHYPSDTLIKIIPNIIGKVLGYLLVVIYTLYIIYEAARNCRDFAELIVLTILPR
ncbi:GerAB/ArcD/ProY family transporter [Pseudalkalibacillus sp. A8]|uniref:GerAB/ArcD/ProY family transporter n=1 Tax=Pseudalkalibacillus sp. A8 TaxID=3382641 RepID=UPI0038B5C320